MPIVVCLSKVRDQRIASHRERLLAVARQPAAPLEQTLHPHTGRPCLTDEAARQLAEMFTLFGVNLNPHHEDFDLVMNTWFELSRTAIALESRDRFGEATYRRRAAAWGKAYVAYLDALWVGSPVAVWAAASALGVTDGIAETGEPLQYREARATSAA